MLDIGLGTPHTRSRIWNQNRKQEEWLKRCFLAVTSWERSNVLQRLKPEDMDYAESMQSDIERKGK